jgi:uncharacterized protein YjbI with pentapeptide repeats
MNKTDISGKDGEKEYADRVFDGLLLKKAEILSKQFYSCVFKNCDFTGAVFRFCKFPDCRFESCNLSLVRVSGSLFGGAAFKDSKLIGVNWTEAAWPRVTVAAAPQFLNCVISDSNFLGLPLAGAVIKNCLARDADFRETDLARADLAGTDFAASLFGKTNLNGADLTRARNYAIRVGDNRVKGAKFSMPEALALLYCLDIKIV